MIVPLMTGPLLASQGGTITCVSKTAICTIVLASQAESAICEIKQGDELNTFYNENFFVENNKFCLCGHFRN